MLGEQNSRSNQTRLDHNTQDRKQNIHDNHDKWDQLEQVDDVYCSDAFNIFNDIY